jgi:hypothetical protein
MVSPKNDPMIQAQAKLLKIIQDLKVLGLEEGEFRVQVNVALRNVGLENYMYVEGPNQKAHLRLKRPNRRMPKRKINPNPWERYKRST